MQMSSPRAQLRTADLAARKRRHGLFVVYVLACCAVAGIYLWHAMSMSSTFLEAELAACSKKCSPFRARLATTRQGLAYQEPSLHGPAYQVPACQCVR
jgi:hypothetical protein